MRCCVYKKKTDQRVVALAQHTLSSSSFVSFVFCLCLLQPLSLATFVWFGLVCNNNNNTKHNQLTYVCERSVVVERTPPSSLVSVSPHGHSLFVWIGCIGGVCLSVSSAFCRTIVFALVATYTRHTTHVSVGRHVFVVGSTNPMVGTPWIAFARVSTLCVHGGSQPRPRVGVCWCGCGGTFALIDPIPRNLQFPAATLPCLRCLL